ncbi:F-box/FBD/LRR-repeat protein At4g26340-like [Ziziphus jujuba]|uniref:F-box/FBD/LRR-repeat protein At4g26340-like n=1 Tax=Ziziphus jujuba TaxID=326968 RepID=A0ABM3ZTV0_ZIZJJ|nr:F-box/FBD/LRR-repeat protein At4g26340-like [Ziziphus jujuba]
MKENQIQGCGISVVQSKNKKNKRDKYNRDRINELSEDILAKIVCLLPLKDAVATSILSKRWRYIWTFTTNLDFDAKQTLNRLIDSKNYDKHKHETRNYIHRVNSVITQLSSKTNNNNNNIIIDRFRIYFDMCRKFSSFIDSWIEFAVENRVQILELDLFESGGIRMSSDCYILLKKQFDHHPGEYLRRTFTLLSSCLPQLQILQLNLSNQIYLRNVVYPKLTNLKQLKLTVNANEDLNLLISRIIPILKVSPCLQRLELKRIIVHPSEFDNYDPAFIRIKNTETISEQEKIRDHAMQHLKGKIPTAVDFEFVFA